MNPSTPEEQLWHELSGLFAEDDSTLPEMRLLEISPDGASDMFDELCSPAEPRGDQTVWLDEREQELLLTETPMPAHLPPRGGSALSTSS
jgi:hypothetical protein